jgi:hypothetical protein
VPNNKTAAILLAASLLFVCFIGFIFDMEMSTDNGDNGSEEPGTINYSWEYLGIPYEISVTMEEEEFEYYNSLFVERVPSKEIGLRGQNIVSFMEYSSDGNLCVNYISKELKSVFDKSNLDGDQSFANFVLCFIHSNFMYC